MAGDPIVTRREPWREGERRVTDAAPDLRLGWRRHDGPVCPSCGTARPGPSSGCGLPVASAFCPACGTETGL